MAKQKFGFSFTARKYSRQGMPLESYERRKYYGVLKFPKSEWISKAEVRRSRGFTRMLKTHKNPRVMKIVPTPRAPKHMPKVTGASERASEWFAERYPLMFPR